MLSEVENIIRTLESVAVPATLANPTEPDCPVIYANPAFISLTGYSYYSVVGKNCRFLQGKGTVSQDVDKVRGAIEARESIEICLLNYKADGTKFHNMLFIDPFKFSDGSVYFLGCQFEFNLAENESQIANHVDGIATNYLERDDYVNRTIESSRITVRSSFYTRRNAVKTLFKAYISNAMRRKSSTIA